MQFVESLDSLPSPWVSSILLILHRACIACSVKVVGSEGHGLPKKIKYSILSTAGVLVLYQINSKDALHCMLSNYCASKFRPK